MATLKLTAKQIEIIERALATHADVCHDRAAELHMSGYPGLLKVAGAREDECCDAIDLRRLFARAREDGRPVEIRV